MTEITRHNWREFVTEQDLTSEEWQRWNEISERVCSDDEFADALLEATVDEYEATLGHELTWEGLVESAIAHRRYVRAVIAAVEEML